MRVCVRVMMTLPSAVYVITFVRFVFSYIVAAVSTRTLQHSQTHPEEGGKEKSSAV